MKESAPKLPNLQETTPLNEDAERLVEGFAQALEVCEENNKEIYALEEIITTPPEKLRDAFDKVSNKYKAIIGVLIFAASYNLSTGLQQSYEKSSLLEEDEFTHTAEKRDKILELTGVDLARAAEKVNRGIKIYTPETPTNLTIVHIGQWHHSPTMEATYGGREAVSRSQAEISSFVIATTSIKARVFVEGYTEEEVPKAELDESNYKDTKDAIFRINTAQNFEQVKNEYAHILLKYGDKMINSNNIAALNKSVVEKLVLMGFKESSPFTYSRETEKIKLVKAFTPQGKEYADANAVTDYMIGEAADILDLNDRITIEACEVKGQKTAYAGLALQDQMVNKAYSLLKFFPGQSLKFSSSDAHEDIKVIESMAQDDRCKGNAECEKIANEIVDIIPKISKYILDDREDEAVEMIAQKATGAAKETKQIFPLIYGTKHDFTRAVSKWNATHPNTRFNLVTVK